MVAIDPGTITGFCTADRYGTFDLSPAKKSVKKNRLAEPEFARCGKLFQLLTENFAPSLPPNSPVIVEGAAAFQRGKAAVRVSHELRGVVKAWCWAHGQVYVEVQPNDLKRYVTGRCDADKAIMVVKARELYGYLGDSDDEADAIHLYHWGVRFLSGVSAPCAPLTPA